MGGRTPCFLPSGSAHEFAVWVVLFGAKANGKQWHKFVCLFCCFASQVNSYGHGVTVSSPNHIFSWASLNKQLISTLCTYFHL